jgi:hypothetical protein
MAAGMKRFLAQRRLPSMMMAMCCGKGLWGAGVVNVLCEFRRFKIFEAYF